MARVLRQDSVVDDSPGMQDSVANNLDDMCGFLVLGDVSLKDGQHAINESLGRVAVGMCEDGAITQGRTCCTDF